MSKDKKVNKHYENLIDGTKSEKCEKSEDVTQYGEFIASFHKWTSFERQKRVTNHLEKSSSDKGENINRAE